MSEVEDPAATVASEEEPTVESLQSQLIVERQRSRALADEVKTLKSSLVNVQAIAEQEEEYRVNKLSKHVEQIMKEKQDLLRQVEQEEEYITNTLVKKLEQVRHEKVDLENRLEQEEEFISNKLQKQLLTVLNEKSKLERRLDTEVTDHHRLAKLETEATSLRAKLQSMQLEHDDYEKMNDNMKDQLLKLKTENFALAQRIKREQERYTQVSEDKLRLMSNMEMGDERRYNTRIGLGTGMRARSVSLPAKPQLPSSKSAPPRPPSSLSTSSTPSSPPMHARSPPMHAVPHPHAHAHNAAKPQGRELISAPVRIRDPNSQQKTASPGGVTLVGSSSSSRSYAAIRDMGTRTYMQLWRMEAAYTNRTQAQDIAIDLSNISNCSLDKNDPRCLTLSFSQSTTSPNPLHFYNQKSSSNADSTKVSHTIDALTLTFEKEEQALEWFDLLKELSVC